MRFAINELHSFITKQSGLTLSSNEWAMVPNNLNGDFAFPCFQMAKKLSKSPPDMAKELCEAFNKEKFTHLEKAVAQGPYLNIYIKPQAIFSTIFEKISQNSWGKSSKSQGKKLIVEFSSPNIAKELGFHHIRSTAIGHSLSRIAENHSYEVTRINYLGDWGTTHGKLLVALNTFGDFKRLENEGVSYMLELYIQFNKEENNNPALSEQAKATFQQLENGNPELRKNWELFRKLSIEEYKRTYKRLGINFDFFDGESLYESKKEIVVTEIENKIGTRVSEGAVVCDIPGQKLPALLKKDDGASLYLTRDIAAVEDRFARLNFNECWYVVAIQQKLHFEQLFAIVKLLGKAYADKLTHIPFGMLAFGSKTMKSREGNVIFLADVLDEAHKKALEIIKEKNPNLKNIEDVAEQIGLGAIIFSDLSQNRTRDVHFKWEEALNFEGDTAPFIQYSHARCASLFRKASERIEKSKNSKGLAPDDAFWKDANVLDLLREWAFFEIYLERALDDKDSSQVAISLLRVAKAFNRLYHHHRILDEADDNKFTSLLALSEGSRWIIKRGLYLLGISAPEEM